MAIGLSPRQVLGSILLPQAVTAMLPSLISQLVVIPKDTALGYIISHSELLRAGQNLSTLYGNLIPTLIVLAAIFILINYGLTLLARLVERRLKRSGRSARPAPGGSTGPGTLVAAGGVGVAAGVADQQPRPLGSGFSGQSRWPGTRGRRSP